MTETQQQALKLMAIRNIGAMLTKYGWTFPKTVRSSEAAAHEVITILTAEIRKQQRERIARAKASGKHLGRTPILKPAQVKELRKRVKAGEDKAEIARAFGISRASVYNYMA